MYYREIRPSKMAVASQDILLVDATCSVWHNEGVVTKKDYLCSGVL